VLRFEPAELVLLGRGENRIFTIDCELRALKTSTRLCPVIGDITDEIRMRQVFAEHRPEVVFHAAAHKHVPLMETAVGEAVKNNVLGTKCVADLAHEQEVQVFVLISSDKAVNPSSVMGATKHLAERYVQALSSRSDTRFEVVRFGNVLGSAGSVVPLFQDQIRRGGPITVTDPRMTRYFMTIPEAAQLVLQATAMGRGGEIYYLDMGEPVRIVDLARDLVRLSGLPVDAIDITFSGIRPGEKLVEELHFDDEWTRETEHRKIRLAEQPVGDFQEIARDVARLQCTLGQPEAAVRAALAEAVPEYQPASFAPASRDVTAVSLE
jgi:FlaA1/EpsC-like NDP-sugar epimerase